MKANLRITINAENEKHLRIIQRFNVRKGKRVSLTELVNTAIASEYPKEFVKEFVEAA